MISSGHLKWSHNSNFLLQLFWNFFQIIIYLFFFPSWVSRSAHSELAFSSFFVGNFMNTCGACGVSLWWSIDRPAGPHAPMFTHCVSEGSGSGRMQADDDQGPGFSPPLRDRKSERLRTSSGGPIYWYDYWIDPCVRDICPRTCIPHCSCYIQHFPLPKWWIYWGHVSVGESSGDPSVGEPRASE